MLQKGRMGQEYNRRKGRKGAFWEDRYHATAIESGRHLSRCLVYIDTNMVRAGVVSHPSLWPFCGYNEIQEPRRKNVLIDYKRLQDLLGAASNDQLKERHQGWVAEYCGGAEKGRKDEWTASIAVGSKGFVERVKELLGFRAKGREVVEDGEGCRVREGTAFYSPFFGAQKEQIGSENTYSWRVKP